MQEFYWKVNVIESERGFGSKLCDTFYFKSKEVAEKWQLSANEANFKEYSETGIVPEWYMQAETPIKEVSYKIVRSLNIYFEGNPKAEMVALIKVK